MPYEISFSPEARTDLDQIYDYIAMTASEPVAAGFIGRIEAFCLGFAEFPARGTLRADLLPGMRMIGFERRVSVGFRVVGQRVIFLRFLYGGRMMEY